MSNPQVTYAHPLPDDASEGEVRSHVEKVLSTIVPEGHAIEVSSEDRVLQSKSTHERKYPKYVAQRIQKTCFSPAEAALEVARFDRLKMNVEVRVLSPADDEESGRLFSVTIEPNRAGVGMLDQAALHSAEAAAKSTHALLSDRFGVASVLAFSGDGFSIVFRVADSVDTSELQADLAQYVAVTSRSGGDLRISVQEADTLRAFGTVARVHRCGFGAHPDCLRSYVLYTPDRLAPATAEQFAPLKVVGDMFGRRSIH